MKQKFTPPLCVFVEIKAGDVLATSGTLSSYTVTDFDWEGEGFDVE